jgi:hypothetical protein
MEESGPREELFDGLLVGGVWWAGVEPTFLTCAWDCLCEFKFKEGFRGVLLGGGLRVLRLEELLCNISEMASSYMDGFVDTLTAGDL